MQAPAEQVQMMQALNSAQSTTDQRRAAGEWLKLNFVATAEQVWEMVQALNNPQSTPDQRRAADEWLKVYQRSTGAWTTLDQLLRAQGLDPTGYFFAAQTLKSKVRKDMQQLDPPSRDALAATLMQYIQTFRHGPLNVRTQLCLAFSTYAGEFDRGSKSDIVQNVCAALGGSPETVPVLLDLLSLLGEEAARVQEDQNEFPPGEDHPLLVSARASALPVLNFTHQCFEGVAPEDLVNRGNIVRCFTRWLRFGTVPPAQIVQSPIVKYAFEGINKSQCEQLGESSTELLCELAYISSDLSVGQPIFQLLTSQLGTLQKYHKKALEDDDETLARNVTRVVAEMAERYVNVLCEGSPDALNMVNFVISCASHSDTQVAVITYRFWYELLKALQGNAAERQRREAQLAPCILQLIPVFCKSAQFPEDCEEWCAESGEEDEFRNFRMEALFDAVLDVADMVSSEKCLHTLLPLLIQQVDASAARGGAGWREVEGSLFVARVFARKLPATDQHAIPALLGLYSKLPEHHRVRQIFTKLIACLGKWLNAHPEYLGPLLDYVVKGLNMPKAQGGMVAAEALQDLCDDCSQHMASPQQLQGMLQIYGSIDSLEIPLREKIVQGLGSIMLRIDAGQLPGVLASLVEPAVQAGTAALGQGKHKGAMDQIKKLRTLMKGGHVASEGRSDADMAAQREALSAAWAQNFVRIWPLLEGVIVQHGENENLMEDMCRCIRSAVQVLGLRFRDYLAPFATAAVNAFLKKPLSCILYAVTTVVSAFGRHAEFVQPLCEMLVALSGRTFQVFNTAEAFSNAPDIVTEYFEMMDRANIRFPQLVMTTPLGDNAFNCAVSSLFTNLQQREALQSVVKFLHGLCHRELNGDLVRQFLQTPAAGPCGRAAQPRGLSMWQAIFQMLTSKDSHVLEPTGRLLADMSAFLPNETRDWAAAALQEVPNTTVAAPVKDEFMRSLPAAIAAQDGAQKHRLLMQALRTLFRAASLP